MPNSLAPQTASYGERLRTLAAQLSAIQMQAAQVMRNATWTDAHGNTWEAIQGANGKFIKIVLVSHGAEHNLDMKVGESKGVHEAARMLREKEGLKDEVGLHYAPEDKAHEHDNLVPVKANTGLINLDFDPFLPPTTHKLIDQYDEHQLGAALTRYSVETLREVARNEGVDLKGAGNNRDKIVTAIVAHVTRDEATGIPRYSADFGKSASGKGESAGKANDANFRPNGLHKPLTPRQSADAAHDYARLEGVLGIPTGQTTGYGVAISKYNDPQELWNHAYGDPERVFRLLTQYPNLAIMHDFINQNPSLADVAARFKRFGRNATAQEMTEALDRHFNGNKASWGRNSIGKASSGGEEHPFAAEYRARLAQLRVDAEKSGYHDANPAAKKAADALAKVLSGKGGKASGKTEGGRKMKSASDVIKSLNEGPQPIRDHINDSERAWPFDPSSPPDPLFNLAMYGEAQLHDALAFYPTSSLRDSFKRLQQYGYAIAKPPVGASREELIQRLSDFAKNPQKGEPPSSTAKTAGAGKKGSGAKEPPLKPITTIPDYVHDPFAPPDPATLARLYGRDQLGRALRDYTVDMLKQTAAKVQREHPGTKPTSKSSRTALIDYIVRTWDAPSERASLPDLTPFARTLAAIHADLRRIA